MAKILNLNLINCVQCLLLLPRGSDTYHFDDSRTLQYTPILIRYMINFFWSIPHRFFHKAIAWPELKFISKCQYLLFKNIFREIRIKVYCKTYFIFHLKKLSLLSLLFLPLFLDRDIIQQKLAACFNIIPGLTSVHEWEGKIEKDQELLLMIKTKRSKVDELSELVRKNHPYDVAEVISLPIENGNLPYLQWVAKTVSKWGEKYELLRIQVLLMRPNFYTYFKWKKVAFWQTKYLVFLACITRSLCSKCWCSINDFLYMDS